MRKKPSKMSEEQYQLGIRQLSPHQKVTIIVRYRGLIQELNKMLRQSLDSGKSNLTPIQVEVLEDLLSTSTDWVTDYMQVLKGEED